MTPPVQKPARKSDRAQLDVVKSDPCVVCGKRPVDPAHVRGRGAGGPDEPWNILSLCRSHHIEQTAFGWFRFAAIHAPMQDWLVSRGWTWEGRKLRHPGLAV